MKGAKTGFIALLLILLVYLAGPKVQRPVLSTLLPETTTDLDELEEEIVLRESSFHLKPDNHARIVWASEKKEKTNYCLVYLHGFSSSQEEGDPVHEGFAARYGMNAYLARLAEHGEETDQPMIDLTADAMWESAKRALAIGSRLGSKVVLLSTSTGGTLSLYLASIYPDYVDALILLSPNVDVRDPRAKWLVRPWGLQIAKAITGSDFRERELSVEAEKFWYSRYRVEATIELKSLIDATMKKETFHNIHDPVLMLYYYKNPNEMDHVVSIPRMEEMFEQFGTPPGNKLKAALPDVGHHAIGSRFFSKDIHAVTEYMNLFAEEVLDLEPIE
jgi:pimeloyl-ACP methyl ester carboxylesterase